MISLLLANLKMLIRNRQALFWALVFPLIFVIVFGLFDVGGNPSQVDMAIINHSNSPLSRSISDRLAKIRLLNITEEFNKESEATDALADGPLEYVLVIPPTLGTMQKESRVESPLPFILHYDENTPLINQMVFGMVRQFLGEVNLDLARAPQKVSLATKAIQTQDVEYFDVLLVGLVGMAVMFNSIGVISVKISGYRLQRILRRIQMTPLSTSHYFTAEILTQLILTLVQSAIILAVGIFVFGAKLHGNIFWLFLIVMFANIVFLNIGFIVGGRANSPGAASGIANVIALPMMFFSGTFFPTSGLPAFLPELVKILPLTPTIEAMRGIAIDGKAIWEVWPQMALISAWIAFSSLVAIKTFKFD